MNLLRLLKGTVSQLTTWWCVRKDLKRLNEVRQGLGGEAVSYVLTGEGGTVLSTLSTLCKRNVLNVCEGWYTWGSPIPARRRLLARADPYDTDLAYRYTEVLCAAAASTSLEADGTIAVPLPMRVFFTEALLGRVRNIASYSPEIVPLRGGGLTPGCALEMTRRFGGSVSDFIDVLYVRPPDLYGNRWAAVYRASETGLREIFRAQPPMVAEAFRRMSVSAVSDCIKDMHRWGLAQDPAFVPLLIAQAGSTSKQVREAAVTALSRTPAALIEQLAAERLRAGSAAQRAAMVALFARLDLPGTQAILTVHRKQEKTARILASIDTVLETLQRKSRHAPDDGTGYTAVDGRRIPIAPPRPLTDGPMPPIAHADLAALKSLIAEANRQIRRKNEAAKKGGSWHREPLVDASHAPAVIRYLKGEKVRIKEDMYAFLSSHDGSDWLTALLEKIPDARAIPLVRDFGNKPAATPFISGPGARRMHAYLSRPDADLRAIEAVDIAAGCTFRIGHWRERQFRPRQKGDFLLQILHHGRPQPLLRLPKDVVWPYLAEHLALFDEAFGLVPCSTGAPLDLPAAIELLALLPAVPARCYAPLLEIGAGERKAGRAQARKLLGDAPGLEEHLVTLLDDSRQEVRAGAAEWLGERGAPTAIPALSRRLKVEKSETARAALFTALRALGEDLSQYFDPDVLLTEAQKGLKSIKDGKLAWLPLKDLASLRLRTGALIPAQVLCWWAELAVKLKQPGGNALLEIYLDQLRPEDAARFSTWVLESWIAYDTAHPSDEEATAYAQARAPRSCPGGSLFTPPAIDARLTLLKANFLSSFPNSGAQTKGLLGLATRTPPTLAVERVRAFLKTHGGRTAQASALLELLAGIGEPVTLQALIAASLRLKQKSIRTFARALMARVAESRNWTLEDLGDHTIPTGGFDENGVLTLHCGEERTYQAYLSPDLSIKLRNPAGKEVSGLPSGQDPKTKAAKKQLSTTRKTLAQVIALQTGRLYEAFCLQRSWKREDWCRSFHAHPSCAA